MSRLNIFIAAVMLVVLLMSGCGDTIDEYTPPTSTTLFSGTGVIDSTPPSVLSTSPTASAANVGTGTIISATFSETMDDTSIVAGTTFVVRIDGGASVAGTVMLTGGTTAVFTPSTALLGNTVYRAIVSNGVRDLSGNALSVNYEWTFTTSASADIVSPTVAAVTPLNGATNVSVNTNLTAVFSESLQVSTVTNTTFVVAGVAGAVAYSGGTATFDPTAALASGTTYTATLYNTIKDIAGNNLASNYIWSFTTAPAPNITTTTLPNGSETASYATTTLTATGGRTPYSYAVTAGALPSGITLNGGGGLSGIVTAATGTYNFTVTLTDDDGLTDSQALSIYIKAGPAIGTTTLPDATATQSYSRTLSVTGGTPAYIWTASAGKPAWLNLNSSTGVLSGTAVAGSYTFDVTVTDSVGATDMQTLTLLVNPAPAVGTSALDNAYVGVAYSFTLAASDGTAPYSNWTATTLPAGLSLNSTTGAISGTPTAAGVFTIDFSFKDANGVVSAIKPLGLNVYPEIVTGLTATTGSNSGEIDLTWTSAPSATSYLIYYDTATPVTTSSPSISAAGSPTTLSGLSISTLYYITVSSVNSGLTSTMSAEASATSAP